MFYCLAFGNGQERMQRADVNKSVPQRRIRMRKHMLASAVAIVVLAPSLAFAQASTATGAVGGAAAGAVVGGPVGAVVGGTVGAAVGAAGGAPARGWTFLDPGILVARPGPRKGFGGGAPSAAVLFRAGTHPR